MEQTPAAHQPQTRIMLVDDHTMLRTGLRMLLERHPGLKVVAEAGTGEQALRLCREERPDLLLADVHLPDGDGIAVVRRILSHCAQTRAIFLSSDGDPKTVQRAVAAGGRGYLLKVNAIEDLITAIDLVVRGGVFFSPEAAPALFWPVADTPAGAGEAAALSDREREVLLLIAEGLRTKEIADRLHLSVKSIETYRSRLQSKLGCDSVAQLVRYAVREGILPP